MAEIPEHLLQRSKDRRKALGLPVDGDDATPEPVASAGGGDGGAADVPPPPTVAVAVATSRPPSPPRRRRRRRPAAGGGDSRIPAHLLKRSKKRRAAKSGGAGDEAAAAAGGGGGRRPWSKTARLRRHRPRGSPQRLLTVVKSGSIQQNEGRSDRQGPHLAAPALHRVRGAARDHRARHDLLGAGACPLAQRRRLQPDAEPVEGPVVLPRAAGTPHDVPPDGRGCAASGHGSRDPRRFALHRQEHIVEAQRPQVRDRHVHVVPRVLGRAHDHRVVLPGAGFNFVFPWNDGIFFEL